MQPDVSIVMPVHNMAPFMPEALASMAAQSLPAGTVEAVVVDDGSTDGSADLLDRWQPPFSVHRIRFPERRGIVAALNAGLAAARGRFIARMDADDRMHPDRLAHQLAFMEANPKVDLCGCRVHCFTTAGPLSSGVQRFEAWTNRLLTHDEMVRDRFVDAPMVHPTWFGRRSFFDRFGGYRETVGAEDYDLLLRAIYEGCQLAKLPAVLLDWRDHPVRETRANPKLKRTALFRQKAAFFRAFEPDAARPLAVFGVGRFGKAIVDALRAEGLDPVAVVDPYDRYVSSRVRDLPVWSLADPAPPDVVMINAYPKEGTPTPEALRYLAGRTVYHWVL